MMSSFALLVVRRRRAVIVLSAVLLIGAGTVGSSAFSVLSSSFGAGPSTQSGRVTVRLDDQDSEPAVEDEPVGAGSGTMLP